MNLYLKNQIYMFINFYISKKSCQSQNIIFMLTILEDQKIFHIADRNKKGIVILVNKWDLVKKVTDTTEKFQNEIIKKISPFSNVPVLFVSALKKQRLLKGLEIAIQVYKNRLQKIPLIII